MVFLASAGGPWLASVGCESRHEARRRGGLPPRPAKSERGVHMLRITLGHPVEPYEIKFEDFSYEIPTGWGEYGDSIEMECNVEIKDGVIAVSEVRACTFIRGEYGEHKDSVEGDKDSERSG